MKVAIACLLVTLSVAGCSTARSAEGVGLKVNEPTVSKPNPLSSSENKMQLYSIIDKGRYGFIDQTGNVRIQLAADVYNTREFSEGLAVIGVRVANTNGRWGFIDESGRVVIEPKFQNAFPFSEGLAAVLVTADGNTGGQLGYIDRTGRMVIKPQFSGSASGDYSFSEGLAAVRTQAGKWGYIDKTGAFVVQPKFDFAKRYSEGFALVGISKTPYGSDYSFGFIDKAGKWLIQPRFTSAENFSEGSASVAEDGLVGYIDRKGQFVIKPQFEEAWPCGEHLLDICSRGFSEGLAAVRVNDKWGFIDTTGKFVIPPAFDSVHQFSEGMAAVGNRSPDGVVFGYIDKNGLMLIKPRYSLVRGFKGGLAIVIEDPNDALSEDPKITYLDKAGRRVWPKKD
jgi:KWG Leptospira.